MTGKALSAIGGTVIPERSAAEICPLRNGISRIFLVGTIGSTGNNLSELGCHYEDVAGEPIHLAELLGC